MIIKSAWLNEDRFLGKRWKLLACLAGLLILYGITWGVSTERAVRCLIDGSPPMGRPLDKIALWEFKPLCIILFSLAVLCYVKNGAPSIVPRNCKGWGQVFCVGALWALPLALTRFVGLWFQSGCKSGSSASIFSWEELSGPAEEVWFAAFVAVWVLLWLKRPYVKYVGIVIICGTLRGMFHVYQGWSSIGLFVWGAVAGCLVALTGRWVILFILHYINNSMISAGAASDVFTAYLILFACLSLFLLMNEFSKTQPRNGWGDA